MSDIIFSLAMAAFNLICAISRQQKPLVILHAALAGFFLALVFWSLNDIAKGVST